MNKNTTEYNTFKTRLLRTLSTELGDGITIRNRDISASGGATLDACSISIPGKKLSPVFYPGYYYEKYREGMSLEEIIENVKDSVRYSNGDTFDEDDLKRYDFARGHVIPKLVNREQNAGWLPGVVHMQYLDMEVVFIYVIKAEGDEIISFTVGPDLFKEWEIDIERLFCDSIQTAMRLFPMSIESIEDVLGLSDGDMYQTFFVMSNNKRHYGAACVLYDHALSDFAGKLGEDFFVLPSSIHEVLLVPDSLNIPRDELCDMLVDVNEALVRDDEVLSNNVYHYDRETDTLTIR